jgi:hypothetical protein
MRESDRILHWLLSVGLIVEYNRLQAPNCRRRMQRPVLALLRALLFLHCVWAGMNLRICRGRTSTPESGNLTAPAISVRGQAIKVLTFGKHHQSTKYCAHARKRLSRHTCISCIKDSWTS